MSFKAELKPLFKKTDPRAASDTRCPAEKSRDMGAGCVRKTSAPPLPPGSQKGERSPRVEVGNNVFLFYCTSFLRGQDIQVHGNAYEGAIY